MGKIAQAALLGLDKPWEALGGAINKTVGAHQPPGVIPARKRDRQEYEKDGGAAGRIMGNEWRTSIMEEIRDQPGLPGTKQRELKVPPE